MTPPTIDTVADYVGMKAAQKKQVFGRVIRAANEDQRKIIDVYEAQIGNVEPSS